MYVDCDRNRLSFRRFQTDTKVPIKRPFPVICLFTYFLHSSLICSLLFQFNLYLLHPCSHYHDHERIYSYQPSQVRMCLKVDTSLESLDSLDSFDVGSVTRIVQVSTISFIQTEQIHCRFSRHSDPILLPSRHQHDLLSSLSTPWCGTPQKLLYSYLNDTISPESSPYCTRLDIKFSQRYQRHPLHLTLHVPLYSLQLLIDNVIGSTLYYTKSDLRITTSTTVHQTKNP